MSWLLDRQPPTSQWQSQALPRLALGLLVGVSVALYWWSRSLGSHESSCSLRDDPCPAYVNLVQQAVDDSNKPILNQAQLLWIASALHGGHASPPGRAQFLVFGLGNDSPLWARCEQAAAAAAPSSV